MDYWFWTSTHYDIINYKNVEVSSGVSVSVIMCVCVTGVTCLESRVSIMCVLGWLSVGGGLSGRRHSLGQIWHSFSSHIPNSMPSHWHHTSHLFCSALLPHGAPPQSLLLSTWRHVLCMIWVIDSSKTNQVLFWMWNTNELFLCLHNQCVMCF